MAGAGNEPGSSLVIIISNKNGELFSTFLKNLLFQRWINFAPLRTSNFSLKNTMISGQCQIHLCNNCRCLVSCSQLIQVIYTTHSITPKYYKYNPHLTVTSNNRFDNLVSSANSKDTSLKNIQDKFVHKISNGTVTQTTPIVPDSKSI